MHFTLLVSSNRFFLLQQVRDLGLFLLTGIILQTVLKQSVAVDLAAHQPLQLVLARQVVAVVRIL
jgi:hypothetical protein